MLKVLVVNDEAALRLMCRINLEQGGMAVLEAADGNAGLEAARTESPDAILLDVLMPGRSGFQVAEELLDDPTTSSIPIVFLWTRNDLRDDMPASRVRGLDVLFVPFDPTDLPGLVRDLVANGTDPLVFRRAWLDGLRGFWVVGPKQTPIERTAPTPVVTATTIRSLDAPSVVEDWRFGGFDSIMEGWRFADYIELTASEAWVIDQRLRSGAESADLFKWACVIAGIAAAGFFLYRDGPPPGPIFAWVAVPIAAALFAIAFAVACLVVDGMTRGLVKPFVRWFARVVSKDR